MPPQQSHAPQQPVTGSKPAPACSSRTPAWKSHCHDQACSKFLHSSAPMCMARGHDLLPHACAPAVSCLTRWLNSTPMCSASIFFFSLVLSSTHPLSLLHGHLYASPATVSFSLCTPTHLHAAPTAHLLYSSSSSQFPRLTSALPSATPPSLQVSSAAATATSSSHARHANTPYLCNDQMALAASSKLGRVGLPQRGYKSHPKKRGRMAIILGRGRKRKETKVGKIVSWERRRKLAC